MKNIQITITGDQGAGKTTLGSYIANAIRRGEFDLPLVSHIVVVQLVDGENSTVEYINGGEDA